MVFIKKDMYNIYVLKDIFNEYYVFIQNSLE